MYVAALVLCSVAKEARAQGLDLRTAARTLGVPTAKQSFWSRPEVAALLLPEMSAGIVAGMPNSPPAIAASLTAIAQNLPEAAGPVGPRVQAGGRDLAGAISSLDEQIAALGRAFDPAEAGRLVEELAAIDGDASAVDESVEVRDIMQKQLDTVRNVEARIKDATGRRARLSARCSEGALVPGARAFKPLPVTPRSGERDPPSAGLAHADRGATPLRDA